MHHISTEKFKQSYILEYEIFWVQFKFDDSIAGKLK